MTYETEAEAADQRFVGVLAPNLALLSALRETRNITRAAELLEVPQPTLSRRLAALAEALGAPLTEPAGRGIRLTRVGTILADTAGRALTTVEAGARQAREELEPATGHVVLGFLHLLGRRLVPSLLGGFRAQYPGVRFTLVQGSRRHILDRLATGELDLALVAPVPDDPNLESSTLAEQDLLLCVPAGHRLAHRRRVRFAELADEAFVTLEHGYGVRQITDALCAEAGFEPKIAFEGQESDTVRGLVAAGLGVAVLPEFGARTPDGVVEIPLAPKVSRTICLTWPTGDRFTPAVRSFRDYVLAQT
ncbi:LysR family transcriptional regulator [Amycolatopsis acidiphila]|uniref:LysR family transcriptional regulator n=1 Tax=Amycolatopsis acidiphila TaxID=715473 RepID=A0A558A072_9PSEU|nr:LysR family transcriptional regulator [Amycolatopsis acidiphila]TVT17659.1 LysR family transcriptional regulator [Amycolatopsis acidiphila]UIJ60948.1 LysR family transcriptional regulator [Amycolatopsis acidiphila]GHG88409.1 LysR family transcriptional regulator [Amycolatopsis acidiphila]